MSLERSDIVLVPFPFTDLSSTKVRPALIISSDPQGEDIVIAFISSVVPDTPGATDFLLSDKHPDFTASGLKKNSVFKMRKILTISSTLILRRLGRISAPIQKELDNLLKKSLALP